jgi:AcrR family transcriptional regulator
MSARNTRPNRKDVRSSIIETAREIAATEGWSAVTVRKVAQSIGYTAPIIYEHFGSKDDMLRAILSDSHKLLFEQVNEAVQGQTEPRERLRAMCLAYWKFAFDTPELYKLMHGMDGARCADKAPMIHAQYIVTFVGNELTRFNPERINASNAEAHVVEAWSMLHGLIALELSGYVGKYAESEKVRSMVIDDLLYGLSQKSAAE